MKPSARADEDTICGLVWWVGFVHSAVGIWLVGGKKHKHLIERLEASFSDNKLASQPSDGQLYLQSQHPRGGKGH